MSSVAEFSDFIVSQPYALLNDSPAVRRAVLKKLLDLQGTPGAMLAGSALVSYIKAGLSVGRFAHKLNELIELGMSPLFEWTEGGQRRNVLDAIMHYGASDAALLLVKGGIGYGYLSLPLYDSAPQFLSMGSPLDYDAVRLPPLKPSTQQGGYCLAHVLAEHGTLQEIERALACGLNFSQSSSNVPHPLVLAALNNRAEAVAYFLQFEEQLKTVHALLDHALSRKYLTLSSHVAFPAFQQIHTYATTNYPERPLSFAKNRGLRFN